MRLASNVKPLIPNLLTKNPIGTLIWFIFCSFYCNYIDLCPFHSFDVGAFRSILYFLKYKIQVCSRYLNLCLINFQIFNYVFNIPLQILKFIKLVDLSILFMGNKNIII